MQIRTEGILIGTFAYMCAGAQMVPISWQEMQCPVTFQKEFRKVAKVV
jgi:exosome complex component CSL4